MKLSTISRLTGAIRDSREPASICTRPYSLASPFPPWVWMARSTALQTASPAAYLAMLAASPAFMWSPAA